MLLGSVFAYEDIRTHCSLPPKLISRMQDALRAPNTIYICVYINFKKVDTGGGEDVKTPTETSLFETNPAK